MFSVKKDCHGICGGTYPALLLFRWKNRDYCDGCYRTLEKQEEDNG